MSIVNWLMAYINEINRTIVVVDELNLADKFKQQRLYELDQDKVRQEKALNAALLKESQDNE